MYIFTILLYLITILVWLPKPVYATTYMTLPATICHSINISASENPVCTSNTNTTATSYDLSITLTNNDTSAHTINYATWTNVCQEGYLATHSNGISYCAENNVHNTSSVKVNAQSSAKLDIQDNSLDGTACGSYQMDFDINSVDSDNSTSCQYGSGSNSIGASGLCQTTYSCSIGSITNLNFHITPAKPWWQVVGLDARPSQGFANVIPPGLFTLIPKTTDPGILFTGGQNYNPSPGQVSSTNRSVGGSTNPELFNEMNTNTGMTSYAAVSARIKQSGGNLVSMFISSPPYSTCSSYGSCVIPSNLPSGEYLLDTDPTNTGTTQIVEFGQSGTTYTFPANSNYIFLVHGSIRFLGPIHLPTSSTVLFSASGDIRVAASVIDIQGFFSADGNFIVEGNNSCPGTSDLQLSIEGSAVVNAGKNSGTFQQNRDLCGNDVTSPAVSFTERPDLILNAPDLFKIPNYRYTEVAP